MILLQISYYIFKVYTYKTLIWKSKWVLGITFDVSGYTTLLRNQKLTCNDKFRIEYSSNQNTSKCKEFCDQNTGCKYFFFHDGAACILYSSCIEKRTPGFYGSTYQKHGK